MHLRQFRVCFQALCAGNHETVIYQRDEMKDLRILLVEDNPDDEFLTLRILAKLNHTKVDIVHEGGEALKYLFGNESTHSASPVINKPDLILLDMRMPLVDGLDFLEAAHNNLRSHEIPVIVISSSKLDRDVERCFELGVKAYLTKPINSDELKSAIKGSFAPA